MKIITKEFKAKKSFILSFLRILSGISAVVIAIYCIVCKKSDAPLLIITDSLLIFSITLFSIPLCLKFTKNKMRVRAALAACAAVCLIAAYAFTVGTIPSYCRAVEVEDSAYNQFLAVSREDDDYVEKRDAFLLANNELFALSQQLRLLSILQTLPIILFVVERLTIIGNKKEQK